MMLNKEQREKIGTLLIAKDAAFRSQGVLFMEQLCETPEEARSIIASIDPVQYVQYGYEYLIRHSHTRIQIIAFLATLGDPETLAMTTLSVNYSSIEILPEGLEKLMHLKKLSVRGNKLTKIDKLPANLEYLDLYGNNITSIHPSIHLPNLQEIRLASNPIAEFPVSFIEGPLEKLTITTTKLTDHWLESLGGSTKKFIDLVLETDSATIQSIRELHKKFPSHKDFVTAAIAKWHPGFESVFAFGNHSSHQPIPTWLKHLHHIEELCIHYVSDTKLPDWFFQFTMLKKLTIKNSQLTTLGSGLTQLQELESLSVVNGNFQTLPPELRHLPKLSSLDLEGHHIDNLPDWIGELQQLETLKVNQNQIGDIPQSIGQLTKLSWLHLSQNNISTLPDEIGQLTKLLVLYIDRNPIQHLPKSFSNLPLFLKSFPLSLWNSKEKLHHMFSFSNIELEDCLSGYLYAFGKDAKPLIDAIIQRDSGLINSRGPLKRAFTGEYYLWALISVAQWNPAFADSIEHLNLSESDVCDIPDEITYLSKLKTLTLTNSGVRTISDKIGELKELTHLYLGMTKVKSLPASITKLTKMKYLNLYKTPITSNETNPLAVSLPNCRIVLHTTQMV